jgi:prophage regulatory protein
MSTTHFVPGHEASLTRPLKLLSYNDLANRGIPWSRVQVWRLEKRGRFPKRVSLSTNRCGWFEHEIDAWLQAKRAERDGSV